MDRTSLKQDLLTVRHMLLNPAIVLETLTVQIGCR